MNEINIKDSLKITPMQVGGDAGKVQLILNGYLDTYNSPEFQNHINNIIESGVTHIIFNCNGLNYISSTGIGAFTSFLKLLKQRKGDMVLYGLQRKVLEVFQLLGFTKFFKISETLDDGLAMLEGKSAAKQAKETTEAVEELGTQEEAVFPVIFACPHCGKKLKTSKSGKFRCSDCKGIIAVDDKGTVKAS